MDKTFLYTQAAILLSAGSARFILGWCDKRTGGVTNYRINKFLDKLFYSHPYPEVYEKLIRLTNVREGEVVLDVGCGDLQPLDLEDRTYGVIGVDKSRRMLEEAVNRGATLLDDKDSYSNDYLLEMIKKSENNAVVLNGDIRDLPLEDNSLDAVISKDVLQYNSDWEKAVEEMYRVIKPVKAVAITITPFNKRRMLTKVERKLKELGSSDVKKERKKIGYVSYLYGTKPISKIFSLSNIKNQKEFKKK